MEENPIFQVLKIFPIVIVHHTVFIIFFYHTVFKWPERFNLIPKKLSVQPERNQDPDKLYKIALDLKAWKLMIFMVRFKMCTCVYIYIYTFHLYYDLLGKSTEFH